MASLETGTVVGNYRIERAVGRGGMGVVYLAMQLGLNRRVALKVIAPDLAEDPGYRDRFKHEAQVAASIDHPNVIPVYEAGEAGDMLFLSMRFVQGTDLRALIRAHGRLDPRHAARIVAQVAAALDAAHAAGLVHRDVKPANVLLAAGAEEHVYLTDFGLTKRASSEGGMTKPGTWVGTAEYVAPEQIQGQPVDARTDVYSLGCLLFQSLTGSVPFPRDSDIAKVYAHLSESPPSVYWAVPDVPEEMDAVVRRAMAKDPADRFQSAGDLGRAALAAAEGREETAPERTVAAGAAAPVDYPTQALGRPTQAGSPGTSTGETASLPPYAGAPAYAPAYVGDRAPGGPTPTRRGARWPWILAGLLLLAGAGVGIAIAAGAFSTTTNTVVVAAHSSSNKNASGPLVTRDQVQSVLQQYANDYSNEDLSALGSLFAPNLNRTDATGNPPNVTTTRSAALDIYRQQFAMLTNPRYSLNGVTVAQGHGEATAQGGYVITADNTSSPSNGSIRFHLSDVNGTLMIDAITLGK
jgi:hypothetical protein